ncbi:MAG: hypothetical protein VB100_09095 [Angelakisella sp.]|nr:hypothetical protein [Angelakisella sp.]
MSKRLTSTLFIFMFILTCSIGCKKNVEDDVEFAKMLIDPKVKDINKSIQLSIFNGMADKFYLENLIGIGLENHSTHEIYFPANSNLQILYKLSNDAAWSSLEPSKRLSFQFDHYVLKARKDYHATRIVSFIIDDAAAVDLPSLRIVVTGYLMDKGSKTDTPVSAYMDIKVGPSQENASAN